MAERKQLEFFLLRYVPDAVKGEFVNFGLVTIENGAGRGQRFADVRFTKDWRRVLCLDPQADLEMLAALEREIREEWATTEDRERCCGDGRFVFECDSDFSGDAGV